MHPHVGSIASAPHVQIRSDDDEARASSRNCQQWSRAVDSDPRRRAGGRYTVSAAPAPAQTRPWSGRRQLNGNKAGNPEGQSGRPREITTLVTHQTLAAGAFPETSTRAGSGLDGRPRSFYLIGRLVSQPASQYCTLPSLSSRC